MIQEWQRAFILHTKPYTESSLLVDLFIESKGLITAIAKGVRRKNSIKKAHLQLFTPLMVQFYGNGNLKTLTQVESLSLPLPLTGKELFSAFYLNELVHRVILPEMETTTLFSSYLSALQQLAKQESSEKVLRAFEFNLLIFLGYNIDFTRCAATGDEIIEDMQYQYHPEKGFVSSLMKNSLSYSGKEILAFANRNFEDAEILKSAKRFLRMVLKIYVGTKPFKSRELFLIYK